MRTPLNPTAPRTTQLAGVRVEVDVTPRWFAPGPAFIDDAIAILGALLDSSILPGVEDVQIGLAGVRVVLFAPGSASFADIEVERDAFRSSLDQLDLVSLRRRRVTEEREASNAFRVRCLQAVPGLPGPPGGTANDEDAGKGPPDGGNGPSGSGCSGGGGAQEEAKVPGDLPADDGPISTD